MRSCNTCIRGPERKSDIAACRQCDEDLHLYAPTKFESIGGFNEERIDTIGANGNTGDHYRAIDKKCFGQYMHGPDAGERDCDTCPAIGDCILVTQGQGRVVEMPHPDEYQVDGDHYAKLRVQPWTAMESWLTRSAFCGFLQGNVIKYVARDKSDKLTDLRKAKHYLEKLIHVLEHNRGA